MWNNLRKFGEVTLVHFFHPFPYQFSNEVASLDMIRKKDLKGFSSSSSCFRADSTLSNQLLTDICSM